jgi:circadian clock protein KaiB
MADEMSLKAELLELRLYIANGTPNSTLALRNIQMFIDECLPGSYTLEIIDVLKEPSRAIKDGILVTPSLVKLSPPPRVSIIGNLSDREKVLSALIPGESR